MLKDSRIKRNPYFILKSYSGVKKMEERNT